MTCKDCIHHEVCNWVGNDDRHFQFGCKLYFKDKSRFAELPCKLGDVAYWVASDEIVEFKANVIDAQVTKHGVEFYIVGGISEHDFEWFRGWLNKDVFLTREEAEKKLEEMKK